MWLRYRDKKYIHLNNFLLNFMSYHYFSENSAFHDFDIFGNHQDFLKVVLQPLDEFWVKVKTCGGVKSGSKDI